MASSFTAYDNGIGFANTFRLLFKRTNLQALMEHGTYIDGTLIMPTVINGALACELFLKALLTNPPKTHSIIKLLDEVEKAEPGIKQLLENSCIDCMHKKKNAPKYDHSEYEKDLGRIDHAFDSLRYWHEPKKDAAQPDPVFNLGFLDVFIALLEGICKYKYGPRPLPQDEKQYNLQ